MDTRIIVVSLPDAVARRATFRDRAAGSPLRWGFFEARRGLGPGLSYDPDEAIVCKGRALHPGELGCYGSHYAAWAEFVASGARQLLVLEDDTIVDWRFLAKLVAVDLEPAGVAYLRLYAKRLCAFRPVIRNVIEPQRNLIEYLGSPFGTQGYLLTRTGAERLLAHCRRVRRPIDDEMDRSWDHGIPNLGLFPFPVIEESTASSIGAERFTSPPIPLRLRPRRFRVKLRDRLLRLRQRLRSVTERDSRLRDLAVA